MRVAACLGIDQPTWRIKKRGCEVPLRISCFFATFVVTRSASQNFAFFRAFLPKLTPLRFGPQAFSATLRMRLTFPTVLADLVFFVFA